MTTFSRITLLYTARIQGKLDILPRLFTLIKQQRQAAQGPVFLLDTGDTCALESWVCQATQGRAPFLVLDSMGYDGAIIGGGEQVPIPPFALRQLVNGDMLMQAIIWDRTKTLTKRGLDLTLAPGNAPLPESGPVVRVDRASTTLPAPGDSPPVLGDVEQGALAQVVMAWPQWTVVSAHRTMISEQTPADPTIAAVIELVESEARHHMQGQEGTK